MTPLIYRLLSDELTRLLVAGGGIASYAFMCLIIARRERIKRRGLARFIADKASDGKTATWRVIHASQTGTAEEIARLTAETFQLAGAHAQLQSLSELDAAALAGAERVLFVVSTYGEGDPPDNGAVFAQRLMDQMLPLENLHYGLLMLGDSSYAQFCGFGRRLDDWLTARGASALFPAIIVDKGDPEAIESWFAQLSHLAGTDDAPDWQAPAFSPWRLSARKHLNPGSQGNPIFHLEFDPEQGELPIWEAGDLAQIQPPGGTEAGNIQPREYSIASIPDDGRLHLLVRLHRHADGETGTASGWLTQTLAIGDSVPLRVRRHERFRLGNNTTRPLILIGNGSGLAGLRSHLKARAVAGSNRNWLLFGERNAEFDYHYRTELEGWRDNGLLARLDAVFSRDKESRDQEPRDQTHRLYVQNRLLEAAEDVRIWVDQGAAIYVCGSLQGMAAGVDEALTAILGRHRLEDLAVSGRYRRDVY